MNDIALEGFLLRYRCIASVVCAVAMIDWFPLFVLTADAAPALSLSTLQETRARLLHNSEDLVAFMKAYKPKSGYDYEIAKDLGTIAEQALARLESTEVLLLIYHRLSCHTDRVGLQEVILDPFRYYAKYLTTHLKELQEGLPRIKAPGLAVAGAKLRDELRQFIAMLEGWVPPPY
jgi:hypothetical protein